MFAGHRVVFPCERGSERSRVPTGDLMRFQQGIHHHLPRSSGDGLVTGGKIREGELGVERGLILRFVLGVKQPQSLRANRSLQTFAAFLSGCLARRNGRWPRVPSQLASNRRVVPSYA